MKFLALDIETTGLDMEQDQILEFGAVAVDTLQPPGTWKTLHLIINYPRISGSAYALSMHNRIFEFIKKNKDKSNNFVNYEPEECTLINPAELHYYFTRFCERNLKEEEVYKGYTSITVAGKNAANFDIPFLKKHFNKYNDKKYSELNDDPNNREKINFRKRVIDPAILYTDFTNDSVCADMSVCKERAGLGSYVSHNAIEDAWDVVMLICKHIGWKINDFITEQYINENWLKSDFQGIDGVHYMIETKTNKLAFLIKHESNNPFAIWEIREPINQKMFFNSNTELKNKFIWNKCELAEYLPIKGEA